MSREFDMASDLETAERQERIKYYSQLAKPETHPDFDGKHCVDCEVEIPTARLNMGKVRCTSCQEFLERLQS